MRGFLLSLAVCSAVMTALSIAYICLCKIIGNRWSPKWRYYVWLAPVVGFLTPFKPQIAAPVAEINIAGGAVPAHGHALPVYAALTALWAAGAVGSVLFVLIRYRNFTKTVGRLACLAGEACAEALRETASALGMKIPELLVLPQLGTPMTTGYRTPKILLPAESYDPAALRLILKHELIHIKRHDLFVKAVVALCRAVHWFNPFMFILAREIDQACELSCDEAVVRGLSSGTRKIYCDSILETVKRRNSLNDSPILSSGFGGEKKGLKSRLVMIFSDKKRRSLIAIGLAMLAVTVYSGTVFAVRDDNGESYSGTAVDITTTVSSTMWPDSTTGGIAQTENQPNPEGDYTSTYSD